MGHRLISLSGIFYLFLNVTTLIIIIIIITLCNKMFAIFLLAWVKLNPQKVSNFGIFPIWFFNLYCCHTWTGVTKSSTYCLDRIENILSGLVRCDISSIFRTDGTLQDCCWSINIYMANVQMNTILYFRSDIYS